jgi:hypothetical protein
MRIYAELPARAGRQLLGDLLVAAWALGVVGLARFAYDLAIGFAAPAHSLTDAGDTIRKAFSDAAGVAAGVPFIGSDLAKALGAGTNAGSDLARAGSEQVAAVGEAALGVEIGIIVLGAVPVVLVWLAVRVRWARRASSAIAARELGPDLLALRALTRRSTRSLLRTCPDPFAAWHARDPVAMRELAGLELRTLGLRAGQDVRW